MVKCVLVEPEANKAQPSSVRVRIPTYSKQHFGLAADLLDHVSYSETRVGVLVDSVFLNQAHKIV